MNYRLFIYIIIVNLISLPSFATDIAVIVHPSNPISQMTIREVFDLYLGRTNTFAGTNIIAKIYDQPVNSKLRELFFYLLNGTNLRQVNTYLAIMRFSGDFIPPKNLENSQAIIDAVSNNTKGIGYIELTEANQTVKIVLTLLESAAKY